MTFEPRKQLIKFNVYIAQKNMDFCSCIVYIFVQKVETKINTSDILNKNILL